MIDIVTWMHKEPFSWDSSIHDSIEILFPSSSRSVKFSFYSRMALTEDWFRVDISKKEIIGNVVLLGYM